MRSPMRCCGVLALAAIASTSCGHRPITVNPVPYQRNTFLCCTLHFNRDAAASDANYIYEGRRTLSAGTPVTVVGEGERLVRFQSPGDSTIYQLGFRYGRLRFLR